MERSRSKIILPIIVFSQFCCTSLWFAGNGVMDNLVQSFGLQESSLGNLTSAVQFGFIIGTLLFAILTIADRYSPSKVFFYSAILGSLFNLATIWDANDLNSLLLFRFLTGFFLAGIYPVGMKIAADYFQKGLGKSLGYLVGALVLGTAFPHLLKNISTGLPWKSVLIGTSSLAFIGGLFMLLLVPDGPYRKGAGKFDLSAFFKVFKNRNFRCAAFGYFGHMWELYTFWAFVPVILKAYNSHDLNIALWAFLIIGIGGLACVVAGYVSINVGTKKTAMVALLLSGLCCILSPIMLHQSSEIAFLVFLLFWGFVVIADSPLFSTLVAQNASLEMKGTALTIVNCIGFAITIVSIQLISLIQSWSPSNATYSLLALGPIIGLWALRKKSK